MTDDALARLARVAREIHQRGLFDPTTRRVYFPTATGWEPLVTPDQALDMTVWFQLEADR